MQDFTYSDPQQLIQDKARDRQSVFIFPSEIAADRGMRIALKQVGAVEKCRFASWDYFKESYLSKQVKGKRPVTRLDLLFFCTAIANNNCEQPFLQSIIRREYHKESSQMVTQIEQAMDSLFLLQPGYESVINHSLEQDLKYLYEEFEKFKIDNNLFESEIIKNPQFKEKQSYFLIYPQLILDFEEYEPILNNYKCVSFIKGSNDFSKDFRFQFYENERDEAADLIWKIRHLLETDPDSDIMITCASPSTAHFLQFYADRQGICLDFRIGKLLSQHQQALFFNRIRKVVSLDFQFEAMRELLLNHSPAWKPEVILLHLDMLKAGSAGFVLEGKSDWSRALYNAQNLSIERRKQLRHYFKRFSGLCKGLVMAKDYKALNQAVQNLFSNYLDEEALVGGARRCFESILDRIKELERASALLKPLNLGSPFSIWIQLLGRSLYVEKSQPEGIPVYDYRVGAGCFPKHHFVCGINERSSSVIVSSAPILSDPEKERWSAVSGSLLSSDFSERFLRVYPYCGEQVFISGSELSAGRIQSVPALWLVENRINQIKPVDFHQNILSEQDYKGLLASRENSAQLRNSNIINADKNCFEDTQLIASLYEKRKKSSSLICLSPSFLENFKKCPWRVLTQRMTGSEYLKDFQLSSPAFEGSLMHQFLFIFYEAIVNKNIGFSESERDKLFELLKSCGDAFFSEIEEKSKNRPSEPEWGRLKRWVLANVIELILEQIKLFSFASIEGCEVDFEQAAEGVIYKGRIDQVIRKGDQFYIIDYKRKLSVCKNDFWIEESDLSSYPNSLQMAIYYYLLSQSDWVKNESDKIRLYYYDIKEHRYKMIYDPSNKRSWIDENSMSRVVDSALRYGTEVSKRLKRGDYRLPKEPDCLFCKAKPFCRFYYALGREY